MTEPDARECLHLEVDHRRPLCLGERSHLLLTENDVVEHLGRNALEAVGDRARRQNRKLTGSQPSRRDEYRETAASPSVATAETISSTTAATAVSSLARSCLRVGVSGSARAPIS